MSNNPIEQNRHHLVDLLNEKATLKQDIADDCEHVFEELKVVINKEVEALKEKVTDERVRLSVDDRGKFEMYAFVGSDLLVFNLHPNIFRLPDHNPLWGTSYFKQDDTRGYFGTIYVYNFLAESYLKRRTEDRGYLLARIFINKDRHFMIEGQGQFGHLFRDLEHQLMSTEVLNAIVQMLFAHAIQFDLYVPPYEMMEQVSVAQIQYMGETLKLQTAKRLGFKMQADDLDIQG
jgi:hypothetical protein